jgi:hypothetical protein
MGASHRAGSPVRVRHSLCGLGRLQPLAQEAGDCAHVAREGLQGAALDCRRREGERERESEREVADLEGQTLATQGHKSDVTRAAEAV